MTNLEGYCGRVDEVHVEPVAELPDPGGDLVEVDGLLAAVALQHVHAVVLDAAAAPVALGLRAGGAGVRLECLHHLGCGGQVEVVGEVGEVVGVRAPVQGFKRKVSKKVFFPGSSLLSSRPPPGKKKGRRGAGEQNRQ